MRRFFGTLVREQAVVEETQTKPESRHTKGGHTYVGGTIGKERERGVPCAPNAYGVTVHVDGIYYSVYRKRNTSGAMYSK